MRGWASPAMPLRYVETAKIANQGVLLGSGRSVCPSRLDGLAHADIIEDSGCRRTDSHTNHGGVPGVSAKLKTPTDFDASER